MKKKKEKRKKKKKKINEQNPETLRANPIFPPGQWRVVGPSLGWAEPASGLVTTLMPRRKNGAPGSGV